MSMTALQEANQDSILVDRSGSGRPRPWAEKKVANTLLALVYDDIDPRKAERLRGCASWLTFRVQEGGEKRLDKANFCRVRLCPVCQWRRSLKTYAQVRAVVDYLARDYDYTYLFLTLTVRSCAPEELNETLDNMMAAWDRLARYKDFRGAVKGWFRSLEIVHDVNEIITREMWYGDPAHHVKGRARYYKVRGLSIGDLNPNYDMMHPHFHVLLAVNKSYVKGRSYLRQDQWVELWQRACRVDYAPVVDIRRLKGDSLEVVAEACKYTVKEGDYIVPDDWQLTVRTVEILDRALDRRRFLAWGGVLRDAHKALHLDDTDDGDLLHVDGTQEDGAEDAQRVTYAWSSGYRQYLVSPRVNVDI